jgi:hypothetical protein
MEGAQEATVRALMSKDVAWRSEQRTLDDPCRVGDSHDDFRYRSDPHGRTHVDEIHRGPRASVI